MVTRWEETVSEIDTVDWRGNPLHLSNVKALRDVKTGRIRVYPYEVAKAEIQEIARKFDLDPRDVGSFLMILAKPGPFQEGEVLYMYHLQKLLFYLWKDLGKHGYADSLPRDAFIAAENGPVPENMKDDLQRLETLGLLTTKPEKWNKYISLRIILTDKGKHLAKRLWDEVPVPYKQVALEVKEKIYPLDPETVRHKVHEEYPEYKDSYVKNDIE